MATLLSVLAAFGLARTFSGARRFAVLFAWLLFVFPAVYYITHPSMLYRHPLDPLLPLLGVSAFTRLGSTQEAEAPPREVGMEINALNQQRKAGGRSHTMTSRPIRGFRAT